MAQRVDFAEILEAMDSLPVTIRLLDPPLHEFLPDTGELAVKEATTGLTEEERRLFEAAKAWHEYNPMLGTRGVRLGVIKPGLYAMQVRALMEAALDRVAAGGHPVVEIMIPLTVSREEMALARTWVEAAIAEARAAASVPGPGSRSGSTKAAKAKAGSLEVLIGTMIETPRAALARRRDRRRGRLLLLRHQRPDPDDLRLQPRRCRGPDDVGLPRAGPVQEQPVRGGRSRRGRGAGQAGRRTGAGHPSRPSRSACAASTGATPSRSPPSPRPVSTT